MTRPQQFRIRISVVCAVLVSTLILPATSAQQPPADQSLHLSKTPIQSELSAVERQSLKDITLTPREIGLYSERLLDYRLSLLGVGRVNLLSESELAIYLSGVIEPVYALVRPGEVPVAPLVTLIKCDSPAVFILPDGRLFVTRKMISWSKTQGALFALMAHELSHLERGHLLRAPALLKLRGLALEDMNDAAFADFASRPFSAEEELVADRQALHWMRKGNYPPEQFLEYIDKLAKHQRALGKLKLDEKTVWDGGHLEPERRLGILRKEMETLQTDQLQPDKID